MPPPMKWSVEHGKLLHLCQDEVRAAAKALAAASHWSLDTPVVLIEKSANHKAHAVSVGSLSDLLPLPAAMRSPELRHWLAMQEKLDAREAWQICADGPGGSAFLRQWNLAQQEVESGLLLSIDQLADLIEESRDGFHHSPRELSLVILENAQDKRPELISLRLNCEPE